MNKFISFAACAIVAASCVHKPAATWSEYESVLIFDSDALMKVLVIDDPADSLFLRDKSIDLTTADIDSDIYRKLSKLMLATVVHEDGVGIAGPQVGIGRRIVAVQRFDKEGEPFEVYPNIRITAFRGDKEPGGEGCLSVPGWRGTVSRYRDIDIAYTSPLTLHDTTETVQGFSAVIFQHETDHLDGVIYIDRADTLMRR